MLTDDFGVINRFKYDKNTITDIFLNNSNNEIVINYYYHNDDFDEKYLKNYLKEFKKGLTIAKKKSNFDLKYFLNFVDNYLQKMDMMEMLNHINIKNNMKTNLLDIVLKEKWLNLIIFKNLLLNNQIYKDYLTSVIDKFKNEEYNKWFYQEYAEYTIKNLDYKENLIPESLRIYNKFNNLADYYLKNSKNINYSSVLLNKLNEFLINILNTNCLNFILSNQYISKIPNLIKNEEIIVKIVKILFIQNKELKNNLHQIMDFINNISDKLDNGSKTFINNNMWLILSKILIENQDIVNTLIEIYYEKHPDIILNIISKNDLLKNNFEHLFKNYLINRIINRNKYDLEFDYNVVSTELLKHKFYKLYHDLEIIKTDLSNTKTLLRLYNDNYPTDNNTHNNNIYILTPSAYSIDFSLGHISEKYNNSTYLLNIYSNVNNITLKGSNNKLKSILHPHLGNIKFEYNNKIIKMLPIQFMVLQDIENNNYNPSNYIYSKDFMNKVISSLIFGKIISKNKDNFIINDTEILDYIEVFYNVNNLIDNLENNILEKDRLYDQNTIMMTWINKLLKKKPSTKNQITEYLEDNLSIKFFKINEEMIINVLEKMIKNDYIELTGIIYKKLLY
jgi:hypothetical protein